MSTSPTISITFYGESQDDLNASIGAYIAANGGTAVVPNKVATDATKAAGATATTAKPERRSKEGKEAKAAADAKAAAEAAAAEAEEDPLAADDEPETQKTIEDLRAILGEYKAASDVKGNKGALQEFMSTYGVAKVGQIPSDKFNEAFAKAAALLAKLK